MTEERYLDDPYRRTFEATVTRSLEDRVVLDGTCFYPAGGGQPADRGTLAAADEQGETWAVTGVEKQDTIYHELDGDPPAEGTAVRGDLDWERRHAHMRYHTAQHLLSAHLLSAYDAPTVGNQLYHDRARIDVEHGRFDDGDLASIERRLNELIDRGTDVRRTVMDRERAEAELDPDRTRIELLPDSITEVRIVEVGDYDRTACAGTHVSNTAEIGRLEVTGRETQGSDAERLRFELADGE